MDGILAVTVGVLLLLAVGLALWSMSKAQGKEDQKKAAQAPRQSAPAPIAYTADGRPIYPIVGYTPDGQPVTADRAVGLTPKTSGTSSLAIVAFIVALVIPPLGAILGVAAQLEINRSGQGGSGLAVAAIVIGILSTFALLAILF